MNDNPYKYVSPNVPREVIDRVTARREELFARRAKEIQDEQLVRSQARADAYAKAQAERPRLTWRDRTGFWLRYLGLPAAAIGAVAMLCFGCFKGDGPDYFRDATHSEVEALLAEHRPPTSSRHIENLRQIDGGRFWCFTEVHLIWSPDVPGGWKRNDVHKCGNFSWNETQEKLEVWPTPREARARLNRLGVWPAGAFQLDSCC